MQSEKLIQSLIEQSRQTINRAEKLKALDITSLTWRETTESWNILECLEHLNRYGDFYLPQMEQKIKQSPRQTESEWQSSWLGSYFASSMLPKEKLNKMKTFSDKNPLHTPLDKTVIDRFINQQIKLLELLNQAENVSLNRVKISTSISRLLKLKLGDTLLFYTNHILRHLQQIERIQGRQQTTR